MQTTAVTPDFYDDLAPYYHLIFEDWEASIERQAATLSGIIKTAWGDNAVSIRDVACGIGTQAIGLAGLGYEVEASDLSAGAVARAEEETRRRELDISYSVSDMRATAPGPGSPYDVVICCDNSLPHLLSDRDIAEALRAWYRCLKPGGGCLVTLRDYENENHDSRIIKPYGVRTRQGVTYIPFQRWEFTGEVYDLSLYLVIDDGRREARTKIFRTQYYAVPVSRVAGLMREAGFAKVERLESDYYQPVLVGTRED